MDLHVRTHTFNTYLYIPTNNTYMYMYLPTHVPIHTCTAVPTFMPIHVHIHVRMYNAYMCIPIYIHASAGQQARAPRNHPITQKSPYNHPTTQ